MLIPSLLTAWGTGDASLSRRVNANSQQELAERGAQMQAYQEG